MKKLLTIKGLIFGVIFFGVFVLILITVLAIAGYSIGTNEINKQMAYMGTDNSVSNNSIYAENYRNLLNEYLYTKGYVTLERVVYYLQRTNNILDVSTLFYEKWEEAYLKNVDEDKMQMIPIRWLCNEFKNNSDLPEYTIENGLSSGGLLLDKIDLCYVEKKNEMGEIVEIIDVSESLEYPNSFVTLPFVFPLSKNDAGLITSFFHEQRDVDLGLEGEAAASANYHNGWDVAVPLGTTVYSVCTGKISKIVNTQNNDFTYLEQSEPKNDIGNYIEILCDNGLTVMYHHLQYNSVPFGLFESSSIKAGTAVAKSSTTGRSTGFHLHIGLKDSSGNELDIMQYINFKTFVNGTNYIF